ncbi:hypothetical protein NQ317_009212 [Molorchus minor]|uniref:C2H2-type domain-containing protein n=1 Tax=Molorchus minor TaxID=1323400 RepID=A0ABQ9ITT3_9CUCU|nr:hypothetical protein NQ317_009212 [Molorchus minor]
MGTPGDKAEFGKVVKTEIETQLDPDQPPLTTSEQPTHPVISLSPASTSTADMGVVSRLPQFETFSIPSSSLSHTITKPEAFQQSSGMGLEQATIEDYFTQSKYYTVSENLQPLFPVVPQKSPKTFPSIDQPGPSGLQTSKSKPMTSLIKPKKSKKSAVPDESSSKKSHTCHICQKNFASLEKLTKHQQSHSGSTSFKCEHCKKSFNSKFKLVRHALIHSDRRPFSCSVCERTFHRKDHLKNHIKVHSPQKEVYTCKKEGCKKQYTSLLSYRKHLAVHAAEEGNLTCQICSSSFEMKEEILYHLKIHAGSRAVKNPNEKKFTCDHCDRRFFTKKDVRRHLVVHTGMRDFLCQFCPQRFGRKDHLVRHIKKSHDAKYKSEETLPPVVVKTELETPKPETVTSELEIKSEFSESNLSNPEAFNPELEFSLKTIFEEDLTPFLEQEPSSLFLPSPSGQSELKDLGGEVLVDIEDRPSTSTGITRSSGIVIEEENLPSTSQEDVLEELNPELLQRLLETTGDKNLPLPGFSQTFQSPPPAPPQ